MLITIIFWIIFGGLVGVIASWITGEVAPSRGGVNVVVGIIGAILGGFLISLFRGQAVTGVDLISFLIAVVGAILLILVVRAVRT